MTKYVLATIEDWSKPSIGYQERNKGTAINFMGQEFPSITQLAKHLGIHHATLRQNMEEGLPQEDWDKKKQPGRKGQQINYLGTTFNSQLELANHLDISVHTLKNRITAGWAQEEWSRPSRKR